MQSDVAKSDGIKSDLRIRWPKSLDFGPKSDDSAHRILQIEKWQMELSSASYSSSTRYTHERAAMDALGCEYNHDARKQWPRLFPARLQLAVGHRGFQPRHQEEQRTQRASFVATYHTREHTQQQQQQQQ